MFPHNTMLIEEIPAVQSWPFTSRVYMYVRQLVGSKNECSPVEISAYQVAIKSSFFDNLCIKSIQQRTYCRLYWCTFVKKHDQNYKYLFDKPIINKNELYRRYSSLYRNNDF